MRTLSSFSSILFLAFCLMGCQSTSSTLKIGLKENASMADSATSKIYIYQKGDQQSIHSEVINYLSILYPFKDKENKGIVKTTTRSISTLGSNDLAQTEIEISPLFFAKKGPEVKAYSKIIKADNIEYRDACLFAKKYGGDSYEDFYSIINPLNGEELMTYTNDYIDAVIPDSKSRRFIGFLSSKCEHFAQLEKKAKNQIGVFTYASNAQKISSFSIAVNDDAIYKVFSMYTPNMQFVSSNKDYKILDDGRRLGLMTLKENAKQEDFSKFDIEITFYYGEEVQEIKVILPVTNDAIDINKIVYDKKIFSIQSIL